MKIALLSDIHANIHALEAVWADLEAQHPDEVYCLGDLVGYGAYPNEVIDFIRAQHIPTLVGNYDDGVGFDRDDCGCIYKDPEDDARGKQSLLWTRERTTPDHKAYLRGLAFQIRREMPGSRQRLLFVHGSPRKVNEYLYADRPASVFENIAKMAQCDALFFGHTHLPYTRTAAGVLFVNCGSVGKPKDGDPRAGYVIVHLNNLIEVEMRRVSYPVAEAARAVRNSGLPPHFADLLETGGITPEKVPG
ncbi:MAG: metallophosphoesterase family protein [Anaerolineales bacterium]|nr:metallophosphoesterase family protein [Anaerolineales bacterium]